MMLKTSGFIVHCFTDFQKNRLFLTGRLEDGRSFAASTSEWQPSFHIYNRDEKKLIQALSSLKFEILPPELSAFDGREKLLLVKFFNYHDYRAAGKIMEREFIPTPDGDLKPHDSYLIRRYIRGPVEIEGETRPGRFVDLVFPEPKICSIDECKVNLKIASVDIETDTENGSILAIGISFGNSSFVRVLSQGFESEKFTASTHEPVAENERRGSPPAEKIIFHDSEVSLLEGFIEDIQKADPDIITGWNFLDFDFPRLAERCALHHILFMIGRSGEEAKFFPSYTEDEKRGHSSAGETAPHRRPRSAAALVPGRQVLDALRVFRSGPAAGGNRWDNSSFTLDAVASSVLGEGKLVSSSGEEKIAKLKELYREDPVLFGKYCLKDADLALRILEKTGLLRLTIERASLTGVSLDKAWTSVASFERIYGMELRRRLIAPPPLDSRRLVSGAAGGTVLEPLPGIFRNVAVFDFRSLYPTIMLTFNIDPMANATANATANANAAAGAGKEKDSIIVAPNGAVFSREKGILPELISGYFAARRRALDSGDEEASFVYKILMNSFYGVLGTPSCRYGRTELAGAITSFAKKWLHFARDWFTQKGYRVLYGDTDSLFVETGLGDDAAYEDFLEWGKRLTLELNSALKEKVMEEYSLNSFMELRFEKTYRRFMIPPLRSGDGTGRGRAKGYGGLLLDPKGESIEVKGMEAVRSDYTPLARRIQVELLKEVFSGCTEDNFKNTVIKILQDLRAGKLDSELVYRKRLSRTAEAYTKSTPPQVKAARALGWKNKKGTIEFVWTLEGPEPLSKKEHPLDYDHYAESQVLPAARSIAAAAGWNVEAITSPGKDYFMDGQLELEL